MKSSKLFLNIIRLLISLIGGGIGMYIFLNINEYLFEFIFRFIGYSEEAKIIVGILFVIIFLFIFYLLSFKLVSFGEKTFKNLISDISKIPTSNLIIGIMGMIVGIIIAYFLGNIVKEIPYVGVFIAILIYIAMAYLGFSIGRMKQEDIKGYFVTKISQQRDAREKGKHETKKPHTDENYAMSKILDTSAIIDGRVLDLLNTGFIEGSIVVPNFILVELRHIADSSDDLKRVKGRRGLDILNEIRNNDYIKVINTDMDYEDIEEVDAKLLKLAADTNSSVITNDYNLNKVAKFQNVKVLNINELVNAIKTKLIAGEEITVNVVKEGKEHNQGVGYLDDGTMIVVEDGRKLIGKTIDTVVTSVLQTNAGRMIFVRSK